jgi:hypothetical protein
VILAVGCEPSQMVFFVVAAMLESGGGHFESVDVVAKTK